MSAKRYSIPVYNDALIQQAVISRAISLGWKFHLGHSEVPLDAYICLIKTTGRIDYDPENTAGDRISLDTFMTQEFKPPRAGFAFDIHSKEDCFGVKLTDDGRHVKIGCQEFSHSEIRSFIRIYQRWDETQPTFVLNEVVKQ